MKKRPWTFTLFPIYSLVLICLIVIAFAGSSAISVFTETAPISQRKAVIIDAGHGYPDGGATSCTGILESDINLEISLRLEDLMHLLGIKTFMIRTTSESVFTEGDSIGAKKISDLKNRVSFVDRSKDPLLISIHQNYFSDGRYRGAQVFYGRGEGSRELATLLQNTFVSTVNPGSRRGVKKASGVYLMDNVDCTAVLIECGFLSNPEEESLLRTDSYQKKLCSVIAANVSYYLSQKN